jgi:indolepyruvate ferredoxin oxidoreductase beta subunit
MIKELNILIAGVGGQGVILMSELLGDAAVRDGLRIRGSEVLGMAVRGGSVFSSLRLGSDVYGPLPPLGKCDVMVSMEPSEALRNIAFLSKSSLIIVNTAIVIPFTVSLGVSKYPDLEVIIEKLEGVSSKVVQLDGNQLAREAGDLRTANIVMLGALFGTGKIPIKEETIKKEIEERFPPKIVPVNHKAFDLGIEACQQIK